MPEAYKNREDRLVDEATAWWGQVGRRVEWELGGGGTIPIVKGQWEPSFSKEGHFERVQRDGVGGRPSREVNSPGRKVILSKAWLSLK